MFITQQCSLQGLKTLVTDTTSDLDHTIVFQFAREGAEVIVHGRSAESTEAIISAGGGPSSSAWHAY